MHLNSLSVFGKENSILEYLIHMQNIELTKELPPLKEGNQALNHTNKRGDKC